MRKAAIIVTLFFVTALPLKEVYSSKMVDPAIQYSGTEQPAITSLKEAARQFQSLSRSEQKSKLKEAKRVVKNYKAEKKAGNEVSTNTLLLALLAIFIPPLAVYLHEGETNNRFWISVLLTILGYLLFGFAGVIFLGSLPGIIYALIVILGDLM